MVSVKSVVLVRGVHVCRDKDANFIALFLGELPHPNLLIIAMQQILLLFLFFFI